ncbi:hypothetical protein [Methanobacterium sp. ACI-7]
MTNSIKILEEQSYNNLESYSLQANPYIPFDNLKTICIMPA